MITKPVRVRRTSWRKLRQDALPAYVDNVLEKTVANPDYAPLEALLSTLADLNKTYNESLANALNRSRSAVAFKNETKEKVYVAMEDVATKLEANAKGNEMYILNAGMELHRPPSNHTGELLPPDNLTAKTSGLPGQVKLSFNCPRQQRRQVETFAVEWQKAGADTWQNGTYKNAQRIMVEGLPSRTEVHFRIRCLGTRGRKSLWSDVATAFVL